MSKRCNLSQIEIKQVLSTNEVNELLFEFNEVFNPPLIERVSDFMIYADKLVKNGYVYITLKDNKTVGFVAFYANDRAENIGYLAQIAVKHNYTTQGIGYELLKQFEKISLEKGMTTLKLEVSNSNSHAIKFYSRNNYVFFSKASESTSFMIKKMSNSEVN